MTFEQENLLHRLTKSQSVARKLLNSDLKTIKRVLAAGLKIWLGAFGAFTLGVILSLPWSVWRLFDSNTLAFLAGNVTILLFFSYVVFRLSVFPLIICLYLCEHLLSRIKLATSRKRSPKVRERYVRFRVWRLEMIDFSDPRLIISQSVVSMVFVFFALYGPLLLHNAPKERGFAWVVALGVILGTVVPTVIRPLVQSRRRGTPFGKAFVRHVSMPANVVFFSVVICVAGYWRSEMLISAYPYAYETDQGACLLSPIFPVFNGVLYYDQLSETFIVLHPSGGGMYLLSEVGKDRPHCLSRAS